MSRAASSRGYGRITTLAIAVLVAGCTGAGAPAASMSPAASAAASAEGSAPVGSQTTSVELPAPETTKLTLGITNNLAVGQFLDRFAQDLGLFEKYGLDVDVVSFEGDGAATQAVIAGQVQATESSGGLIISSQLTDTPLVATAINNLRLDYVCVGGPNVKTPTDVKGKKIGVSSIGSVAHAVVLACLQTMGLQPTDVTILAVGSESARIAAVLSGSIEVAPVQINRADQLTAQGLNVLADLTEADLVYATAGLGFRKDFLASNRNTALRLLAAILVAQETLWANPDLAAEKYVAFNGSDLETAKAAIKTYIEGGGNRGLKFTREAFVLPQTVTSGVNPEVANVNLDTVYDLSLLDGLDSLGFNPAAEVEH